jgi:hypothetical protein
MVRPFGALTRMAQAGGLQVLPAARNQIGVENQHFVTGHVETVGNLWKPHKHLENQQVAAASKTNLWPRIRQVSWKLPSAGTCVPTWGGGSWERCEHRARGSYYHGY